MPISNDACRADADHDQQDLDAHSIREIHGVPPSKPVLAVRLFRRSRMVFSASVATIRHRRQPELRREITAVGVVGIERRGNWGTPRLERAQDGRQDDERGARRAKETADHRPPKRSALLSAFAYAQ